MTNVFHDRNILVTGGTGSIGHGIVEKVLQYRPRAVRILSNDENGLNCLEKDLGGRPESRYPRASPWHFINQALLDLNPDVPDTLRTSVSFLPLSPL